MHSETQEDPMNWNSLMDLLNNLESVLLRLACLILLGIALVEVIMQAWR